MKYLKTYLLIALISTFIFSCENDGGTSVIDLRTGAIADIQKSSTLDSFFNLIELEAGNDVEIGYTLEIAQGDVNSLDVIAFYFSGDSTYGPVTLKSNVSTFPYSQTINQNDVLSQFVELNTTSDMMVGDRLLITSKLYLKDGSEINLFNDDGSRNYGSDVHSSGQYNTNVIFPISCPSSLAGTYNVVSNGFSTDSLPVNNPLVNFAYSVDVTDNGGGSYSITDGVAGVYIDWYSGYGYTFETTGNFTDVCNSLSGEWNDAFGSTIVLTGTVQSPGLLNIHWANGFGDECDAVYTLQ